jgi:hypothetical protein
MKRRVSEKLWVLVVGATLALAPLGVEAQTALRISGQIDLNAATPDDLNLNTAFRGDNPYNPVRFRLFANKWVTDRIGIFTELFYDTNSGIRVNGAYAVINSIGGTSWLNARLGLAPSAVGSFGLRSTYFNVNPLIGVPLAWHYRTNLSGSGTSTAAGLVGAPRAPGPGVPLLYDSCWNIQWELLGEFGIFEYSVALSPGSLSSPVRSREVDGMTFMSRLGATLMPGLSLGVSIAEGPYLSPPTPDDDGNPPYPGNPEDFVQGYFGLDLQFMRGPLAIFAEANASAWQTPLIAEDLEAASAFVEVRYDVATQWYLAGRVDGMGFSEVDAGPANGGVAPWDQDVFRSEFAVGYRLSREILLKADWQRTTTGESGWTQNLFAAQLSAVF